MYLFSNGCKSYRSSSNLSFPFNTEEFLYLEHDVLVFSGSNNEEIISELIPGEQSDEEKAASFDC